MRNIKTIYLCLGIFCFLSPFTVFAEDLFFPDDENLVSFGKLTDFKHSVDHSIKDIDVYTIEKDSKVFISYYLGNDLSFPTRVVKEGNTTTKFNLDGSTEVITEWDGDEIVGRELLFSTGRDWPSKMIMWTGSSLSQDELKIAEKIFFSLDLRLIKEWSP